MAGGVFWFDLAPPKRLAMQVNPVLPISACLTAFLFEFLTDQMQVNVGNNFNATIFEFLPSNKKRSHEKVFFIFDFASSSFYKL